MHKEWQHICKNKFLTFIRKKPLKNVLKMIVPIFLSFFLCITTVFAEDTIPKDSISTSTISSLRTTRLAFVAINGFVLPQAEMTSIIASTMDSIILASTIQSSIQENELPLFKVTLKNNTNNTEITNTYQGSSVLYTGLTEGAYTIISKVSYHLNGSHNQRFSILWWIIDVQKVIKDQNQPQLIHSQILLNLL
jgi:hypothetical protein